MRMKDEERDKYELNDEERENRVRMKNQENE
jgi:hypothetical protein